MSEQRREGKLPPEGYGIPQPVLAGALERALTPLQRAQLDRQETTS